jgi:3-hydroxyacyl-CoA dehydrogenase
MNRDHQHAEAKRSVLEMLDDGYRPPATTSNVYAAGADVLASVRIEVYSLKQGGYISEHDGIIATTLGAVLCGGDLSEPAWMDEQYFLDLEREAVLSLAGTPKTQERVMAILTSGKPLRN